MELHRALTAASSQVRWARLGHELVGLDDREVGQPAEVRLEAPDALVGGQHRVVVGRRVLVVDVVAVDRDPVARLPVAHRRPDLQHDARGVGADDVVRQGVAGAPDALLAEAVEEPNVGSGSKIDVHTVLKLIELAMTATYASSGASSGVAHLADVERLAGVLVLRLDPLEHVLLVALDEGGSVGLGDGEGGVVARGARLDGVEDLLHGRTYRGGPDGSNGRRA